MSGRVQTQRVSERPDAAVATHRWFHLCCLIRTFLSTGWPSGDSFWLTGPTSFFKLDQQTDDYFHTKFLYSHIVPHGGLWKCVLGVCLMSVFVIFFLDFWVLIIKIFLLIRLIAYKHLNKNDFMISRGAFFKFLFTFHVWNEKKRTKIKFRIIRKSKKRNTRKMWPLRKHNMRPVMQNRTSNSWTQASHLLCQSYDRSVNLKFNICWWNLCSQPKTAVSMVGPRWKMRWNSC